MAPFGPPLLLDDEDAVAYDQLVTRICTAVNPVDFIDDMLIADVIFLQWEVLRWRRLKLSLMQARRHSALEDFLGDQLLDYLCSDHYAVRLAEILQDHLPEDQAEQLAHESARNEPGADDKVDRILAKTDTNVYSIARAARRQKAKELVQDYARREQGAITLVNELLTDAGVTIDSLMADALTKKLDDMERLDRLTIIAENRRNASLREIERRRTVLGATLRQGVQEIDAEYDEIATTPAKGKSAH
jgi:hypothetical protein